MSQSINHKLLVVLYKMSPSESPTIQSTIDCFSVFEKEHADEYELIIWDNSPESHSDEIDLLYQASPIRVSFVHTPQNMSLSKIYNEVTSHLGDDEYLTLLDQDTFLPISFFKELKLAQRNKWPLILPKVECQGLLVSPGKRFFARGMRLKEICSGAISSKNLLAINSGMSILGKVFRLIQYDERLRFYGTDTFFMRNYEKYFDQVFVLDATVLHSLAEMEQRSDEWWVGHIKEKLRIFNIVFDNSIIEILFVRVYVAGLISKAWLSNFFRISL